MSDKYIGSYKIIDKIGAGGMSTVFLAVHQDVPNLRVVLKLLSDPLMVERFRAEADKLALLDGHSSICQIKHFFNHGDEFAIAMEYIEGTALDGLIKKLGKVPVDEAVRMMIDVLDTLQFAHEHGISHRDIKPSNIMLDKQNRIKIIDFGIAKSESDPNLTVAGSSCGTPSYMAPEQFNPTDTTNYILADIYAVGTTLYYLLTGQLPFKGDNAFALRDAKLFSDPVKPRAITKEISRDLENIILRSLAKEPEERFASADEMRKALIGLGGVSVGPRADLKTQAEIPKAASGKKAGLKPAPIIAVAVAVMAAIIYFVFFSGGAPVPQPPNLVEPANGLELTTATPVLKWEMTAGEGGFYELLYADNANFSGPKTIGGLPEGEFAISKPLEAGTYYWQVRALDKSRQRSDFSETFSFIVPEISMAVARGMINLTISPGGDVYLDGNLKGRDKSELTLELDTGSYVLKVENAKSKQKAFVDTIQIMADASIDQNYRFTFPTPVSTPKPPQQQYGYLRIGSKPKLGAEIIIDGERQPNVTPYRFKLKAGRHIISATLFSEDRQLSRTDTLTIAPNSDEKYLFDFE